MGKGFWGVLTLFFLGTIFVAVMTHAKGFSTAAGTLFTGVNTLGTTLEAGGIKAGSLCSETRTSAVTTRNRTPDKSHIRTMRLHCTLILTGCKAITIA